MDVIVRTWGEETMQELLDFMVGGLFTSRYAKFDITQYSWAESLPTNLYLAMEAMRGHGVGPGRRGNFEFEEDEDRYTFRFDPCGSGGHTLRGDQEVFGTPPRMEPPYNWVVLASHRVLRGVSPRCRSRSSGASHARRARSSGSGDRRRVRS